MNIMKRQKHMTAKDEPRRLTGVQYTTGEEQNNSSRMKRLGQSGNDAELWMCLVVKVKSDAIKINIA